MKKILFLLAIFCTLQVNAQVITFTGTGIGSITVENTLRSELLTFGPGDNLTLSLTTDINKAENMQSPGMKIYPNPMIDNSTLAFYPPAAGYATITVSDMTGKQVTQIKTYVENSTQAFSLSGVKKGLYLVSIKGSTYQFSGKLLSNAKSAGKASIEKKPGSGMQAIDAKVSKMDSKGAQTGYNMLYNPGDYVKFKATSGVMTTKIAGRMILADTTVNFTFYPCTDASGNNYSAVVIDGTLGTQVWMGENLNTTKYRDNSDITAITNSPVDTTAMRTNVDGYYIQFDPAVIGFTTPTKLYNWWAVTNTKHICPTGWHEPSHAEMTTFNMNTGQYRSCYKLREDGSAHWTNQVYSPNLGQTGFDMLPTGFIYDNTASGTWMLNGTKAYMWTTTEYDVETWKGMWWSIESGAYNVSGQDAFKYSRLPKNCGLAVRCLKD